MSPKKKTGRPPIGRGAMPHRINLWLDEELKDEVARRATVEERTEAQVIRRLMRMGLQALEKAMEDIDSAKKDIRSPTGRDEDESE